MVAYSFMRRFAEPIVERTKGGTIRGDRARGHAKPDDELQLYQGMRTRQCRLISREKCLGLARILLNLRKGLVVLGEPIGVTRMKAFARIDSDRGLNIFARFDGFETWDQLAIFWTDTHDATGALAWHVRWLPFPPGIL